MGPMATLAPTPRLHVCFTKLGISSRAPLAAKATRGRS